ncbi:MAG: DNA-binding protein [Sulfolobales archaeon]
MVEISEYYDEELEMIKRRRLAEIMRRSEEAKEREEEVLRELQKQEILRRVLTPEARERLANIKLVKPELAKSLEDYLVSLTLSGRLNKVIDDDELKEILRQIDERSRRDIRITVRRKGG